MLKKLFAKLFRKQEDDPRDSDPNLEKMLQAAWKSDGPILGTVDDDGNLTIKELKPMEKTDA